MTVRRIAVEVFWTYAGQAIAALGALVGVRWLTGAMSKETFGRVALAMTVVTVVNQVVGGPLISAALRFYAPAVEDKTPRALLASIWRLCGWAALATILLALIVTAATALSGHGELISSAGIMLVLAIAIGFSGVLESLQSANRNRLVVAWHQTALQWLRPVCALALIAAAGSSAEATLQGYALATLGVLVSQFVFVYIIILRRLPAETRDASFAQRRTLWHQQIIRYAAPFALWGVFTWVQQASDRWALGYFCGDAAVGEYAAIFQIGYSPMNLLVAALLQVFAPVAFEGAGDGRDAARVAAVHRRIVLMTGMVLLCALLAAGVAALCSDRICALLLAREYRLRAELLPVLVLGGGVYNAAQVFALSFMVNVRADAMIVPKVGSAVLGAAANFAGAALGAATGVAWASVVQGVLFLLLLVWAWKRTQRQPAHVEATT